MNYGAGDDRLQYQAVSVHAVLGLCCGLAGVTAFVGLLGWLVAAAGALLSAVALHRIRRNAPDLGGRKAALAGLILSLLFLAAGPADAFLYDYLMEQEALRFAAYWFDYLRADQPHKAFQLTLDPPARQPLDASLWEFYRQSRHWHRGLEDYVNQPAVRTLLALADRAQVRFYQMERRDRRGDRELLYPLFAVTYTENGEQQSFFLRLTLERVRLAALDAQQRRVARADWQLHRVEGGVSPARLL